MCKELIFPDSIYLHLLRPLYGFPEYNENLDSTAKNHDETYLGMTPCISYHSFYVPCSEDENLEGLPGVYADDPFISGTDEFEKYTDKKLQNFDCHSHLHRLQSLALTSIPLIKLILCN